MTDKPMSNSKTYWFNALNVLAAMYVYWQCPEAFTPEVATLWLSGKGIGNLVLRKFTKAGVKIG